MKIKILLLFLITVALLVLGLSSRNKKLEIIKVGSEIFHVEVARTSEQITKGLGGRDKIDSDGMLFVLPVRQIPHFWMKDMNFGLDFVWIDGSRVVAITPNVLAQSGVPESELKIYSPNVPVTYVLEIPFGEIEKRGIKVGDQVNFQ